MTIMHKMRKKTIYTTVLLIVIPYGSVYMHDRHAHKFSLAICITRVRTFSSAIYTTVVYCNSNRLFA